jgi:hypothetical protein
MKSADICVHLRGSARKINHKEHGAREGVGKKKKWQIRAAKSSSWLPPS